MSVQTLTILGSTGSVGESTLNVLRLHPERYQVLALTANTNVELMAQQCLEFKPQTAVMADADAAQQLEVALKSAGHTTTDVAAGEDAIIEVAQQQRSSAVMSAIVGAAGLLPTLAAVQAGKKVLIANKEPLVMTGDLFIQEAQRHGAVILPIDSEHNAIFQCLPADQATADVKKIHLTASGGPFRGRQWASLSDVTPAQACAHPNWSMGQKISVDSATLMNKGLELIEAAALFSLPAHQVDIIVHPQSIIHSLVEYCDGSFLAQLGAPDMRIPIAHALAWPERHNSGAATLDLTDIAQLDFSSPDMRELPCLALARQAAEQGGGSPAVLNAANEVAVAAFLGGQIKFTDIPHIIEHTLSRLAVSACDSISDVLQIDNEARQIAAKKLDSVALG